MADRLKRGLAITEGVGIGSALLVAPLTSDVPGVFGGTGWPQNVHESNPNLPFFGGLATFGHEHALGFHAAGLIIAALGMVTIATSRWLQKRR